MTAVSTTLVYFSPTDTTRTILSEIARGLTEAESVHINLTSPVTQPERSDFSSGLPVLIGVPVYGGRVPEVAKSRLRRLNGEGSPAVVVVVYGNRAYEDALLELRNIALESGFRPIPAGAFIGEHSYSTDRTPIAAGRPDEADLQHARAFGLMIREKLKRRSVPAGSETLRVPGTVPYKELRMFAGVIPELNASLCSECGKCARSCPTAAIDAASPSVTDAEVCIRCCACVKGCPAKARKMLDARIVQVAEQLSTTCADPKQPVTFL